MAYKMYLDDTLYPITPSKIETKIKGQNKTLTLINDGEINVLKTPGLSEISFELLLPNVKYPKSLAIYESGFQNAKFYLDKLEKLKNEKKSVYWKLTRELPSLTRLYDNEMKVSVEDYTIKEDAKQGFDVVVSVKLKQYRDYGTKIPNFSFNSQKKTTRSTDKKQETTKYTVVSGDTLWNIAKKFYGDGSKYMTIYNANKSVIGGNPNLIRPGQVLTIPGVNGGSDSITSTGGSPGASSSVYSNAGWLANESPYETFGSTTSKCKLTINCSGTFNLKQNTERIHIEYTANGKETSRLILSEHAKGLASFTITADKGTPVTISAYTEQSGLMFTYTFTNERGMIWKDATGSMGYSGKKTIIIKDVVVDIVLRLNTNKIPSTFGGVGGKF